MSNCGLYLLLFFGLLSLASPAMGHWGTCPLDFQLLNFSGHFRAAQTLTLDSMWFPPQKESAGLFLSMFIT